MGEFYGNNMDSQCFWLWDEMFDTDICTVCIMGLARLVIEAFFTSAYLQRRLMRTKEADL